MRICLHDDPVDPVLLFSVDLPVWHTREDRWPDEEPCASQIWK